MTIKQAKAALSEVGMTINKRADGEFCVKRKGASDDAGYFTNDLKDAVATGQHMRQLDSVTLSSLI